MEYSGINAKISAMRGKLLTNADYGRLSKSDSVESVVRFLSEHPAYRKAMSDIFSVEIHRDIVEQKLLLSLSDDFRRIHRFITEENIKNYMAAYFLSFELNVVKLLLCMVYDERDINYSVPELNMLIGSQLKIDTAKLKASKNPEEFIYNLKGAGFYTMLTDAFSSHSSLFEIEMQLDLYYYMNLWNQQNEILDKKNRDIMAAISGEEIDLRNIMWVYRLKKYYNLNDARIYAYLIPISHRLEREQLMKMVKCQTLGELSEEISVSPYGQVFTDLNLLEKSYYNRMSKLYREAAASQRESLAVTVSFVFFKELELKNLTSLLEGVRYKLKPNDIMGYLYLTRKAGAQQ